MKKIPKIFLTTNVLILVFLIAAPFVARADGGSDIVYTMLAHIGNIGTSDGKGNWILTINNNGSGLSDYLNKIYVLGISICTGLAVLMIVIGGIEYMGSGSWGGKDEGKKRINAAIIGLIIALGSFVILNSLNSSLLSTSLNLGDNINLQSISANQSSGVTVVSGGGGAQLITQADGTQIIVPTNTAIDTDGTQPPNFNDPDYKPTTSYQNPNGTYLNANTDIYVVVPSGPGSPPLGTPVVITNNSNGKTVTGIVGDHGPNYGEISLAAGVALGVTSGTSNSTSQTGNLTYVFYPQKK